VGSADGGGDFALDGFGEGFGEGVELSLEGDFLALGVADVDGVDGDAFFGVDAGVGDVVAEVADGFEDVVEEAEAVNGLEFDDGFVGGDGGVDEDALRDLGEHGFELGGGFFLGDDGFAEVELGVEEGVVEVLFEAEAGVFGGDGCEVGVADAEGVEDKVVVAAVEVGAEDVDALGGEGAGDAGEELGAIPAGEGDFGAALFGEVFPGDDGQEAVGGVLLGEVDEEGAELAEVGDDGFGVEEVEVGRGHAFEVGLEFFGPAGAEFFDDGVPEFVDGSGSALHEVGGSVEEFGGEVVEAADGGFFVTGPALGGGAFGVGVGHDEEGVQVGLGADDAGEFFDDAGVFEVFAGGGAVHEEVVVHQEDEELALGAFDDEAAADGVGEDDAFVVVAFGVGGTPGVVHEEGEVKDPGFVDAAPEFLVEGDGEVGLAGEAVEHFDGAEGVFVGGVLVEEFVLDEAGEGAEFGDEAAEEADAVHLAEGATDVTFAGEDGEEGIANGFLVAEGGVDEAEAFLDELEEFGAEAEVALLGVGEEADEAVGVVFEEVGVFGEDAFVAGDEAVELGDFGDAVACEEGEGAAFFGFGVDVLEVETVHDFAGALEDVAGGGVVVPHEGFDAIEDAFLFVAELGGDDALEAEGELVFAAALGVVHGVAGAEDEVVGFGDFFPTGGGDEAFFDEVLGFESAELGVAHPDEVLVVAEAAAAVFDVGFLNEGGVAEFAVAGGEVLLAEAEEGGFLAFHAFFIEAGAKLVVGEGVAAEVAQLHEGGFCFHAFVGEAHAVADGADAVADFEADVIEEHEELADQFGDFRGDVGGVAGEEEGEVDVAAGGHDAAAVAAVGAEGELEGGALFFGEGKEGVLPEGADEMVDHVRAHAAEFATGEAGVMAHADAGFLEAEVLLAEAEEVGAAAGFVSNGTEDAVDDALEVALVFAFGHGVQAFVDQ
jgi:hypothetical protein